MIAPVVPFDEPGHCQRRPVHWRPGGNIAAVGDRSVPKPIAASVSMTAYRMSGLILD